MVSLYTVWYIFVRIDKAVKMAPAMAAGVSKTLWTMDNIVALIDAAGPALIRAALTRNRWPMKMHQVREGEIVRVIDGPFSGFLGKVKDVGDQTVKVAVQVYGRNTPADLALGQVEAVSRISN